LAKLIAKWQNGRVDDELDRTLDAVGPRLKRLRLRRDVTLTDLAEETGISASTLSRLEAGLRRPTLEQLLPLARAHGVTLDELVDAPPTGDPRINLRPVACRTRPSDSRGL
jgi:transcriptional regulator with XRE-family HTH domain